MRALLLSLIWTGCAAGPLQAESAGKNITTVVISDGPFAGTYTVNNQGCLYIKDRDLFGVTFKAFAQHPTIKTLEEAAIQVDRDTGHGATGDVTVRFLDVGSDTPQDYSISNVQLTVARQGKGAQLSFEGKTANHIRMRVIATCDHTAEL